MGRPLNLLLVEDNPNDAELVLRQLDRSGFDVDWVRVETEADFLAALQRGPDLILSDYDLPQFSGLRALILLRESGIDLPLLIVSGTIGEETAVAAMREGAADYLMKDRLVRLGQAVTQALDQGHLRRERRLALAALAESEERFRELAENINEVFWLTDVAKNRMLYVSPAYAVIWGRPCQTLIDSPWAWLEAIHPEDRARVEEAALTRQRLGSYDEEYRIVRPDGEVRWIRDRAFPVRSERGEVYRLVGVCTDITARRRAEQAQRESEDRLRVLIENTSDIISLVDDRGVFHFHGPSVERILGYTVGELQGKSAFDFVHPDDRERLQASLGRALQKTVASEFVEIRFRRKDGAWRTLQVIGKYAGEADGVQLIVVNSRDVTEERALEAQFLRAQRLEAIGSLANGVAHDLNNILSPVMIAAGLLKEAASLQADRHLVEMIEQAARRGADIIRQLLTFSRGLDGERAPVQLRHLVKEMGALMRETFPREIAIETEVPATLPLVRGDATQIHQVLMNLCVNARDAMPTGGRLRVALTEAVVTAAELASGHPGVEPGTFVRLTVVDSGAGIAAANLARIFDPFFTTKEPGKGTGLGLSTVLGIVRSHRGFITVKSEPARGSEFNIHLPVDRGDVLAGEAEEPFPVTDGDGRRVLVVDDEDSLRKTIAMVLESRNYRVQTASNGAEALAVLARPDSGDFALVITDLMMPELGGAELIRQLRVRRPWLPVLATSGQADEQARAQLAQVGVLSILVKPFRPLQLLRAVDEILGARK